MIWHTPLAFILFVPFIGWVIFVLFFQSKKIISMRWSSLKNWSSLTQSFRVWFKWIPFFLQCIAFSMMILALARPQQLNPTTPRSLYGIDIMIAFDISFSMMVDDMYPGNRLSAAKQVIDQFIEGLHSDRVGLILFSGESYTKVPLTLDYTLLREEVKNIETSSDIQHGTAIGVAVANATARLRHSPSQSRIIILLTDGENNAGSISPGTAVVLAQKYDIKIYSIGMGTKKIARIPIKEKDVLGRERTVYATINSQVNKKLLSDMAKQTGGKFYFAKNLKNLTEIFNDIGMLEKSEIQTIQYRLYEEKFQNYLKPAFLLYVLSLILSLTVFGRTL